MRRTKRLLVMAIALSGAGALALPAADARPSSPATSGEARITWSHVAAGNAFSCGIGNGNRLYCWGRNADGELGLGDRTERLVPALVSGDPVWTAVAAGSHSGCAIRFDHTLWCWGNNAHGVLGIGSTDTELHPTQVGNDADWAMVNSDYGHTCGIKLDGSLWCWGWNADGALGDGTTTDRLSPVQIGAARGPWVEVDAGATYTCGVAAGRTLLCWGHNFSAQLGTGDMNDRLRPTRIAPTTAWSQVSAGYDSTCALTFHRVRWCWGDNFFGQIGLGRTGRLVQVPTVGAEHARYAGIQSSDFVGCALRLTGSIWCYGSGSRGELGDRHRGFQYSPKVVDAGVVWTQLSTGDDHSCAVRADHSAWCWGNNTFGGVGDGTTDQRGAPRRVHPPEG